MFRISLLLLSIFTFTTHASIILPQDISTGADGSFNLLTDDILFNNTDGIYNFVDFNIADGITLNISNSGPVYIYSQQSISLSGNIIANTPDLHLIAPAFNTNNATISTSGTLTYSVIGGTSNGSGSTGTGSGITIGNGNPGISPVPLPAAIWLMLSGLLSIGMLKIRQIHGAIF